MCLCFLSISNLLFIFSVLVLVLFLARRKKTKTSKDQGFINKTIDRVGQRIIENDPELNRLKSKRSRIVAEQYELLIETFGSPADITPAYIKVYLGGDDKDSKRFRDLIEKAKSDRHIRTEKAILPYLEEREKKGKGELQKLSLIHI